LCAISTSRTRFALAGAAGLSPHSLMLAAFLRLRSRGALYHVLCVCGGGRQADNHHAARRRYPTGLPSGVAASSTSELALHGGSPLMLCAFLLGSGGGGGAFSPPLTPSSFSMSPCALLLLPSSLYACLTAHGQHCAALDRRHEQRLFLTEHCLVPRGRRCFTSVVRGVPRLPV